MKYDMTNKDLWMQYELEKELQVVEVETGDWNESRIKELQKQLNGQFISTVDRRSTLNPSKKVNA